MAQRKKLQVFVSSTFTDLREERQAAVEAILRAGHIPAGMELFAAGDESQMNVIKRWIDESDVYLLILGTRYGSIEPASQKSYVQLEYEYAIEKRKALFSVVIADAHVSDVYKTKAELAVEADNPQKLKEFKELVKTKMVRFWSSTDEIKLAVLETMLDFASRDTLTGWVPGSEAVNSADLLEEITRLSRENAALREELSNNSSDAMMYNGLSFENILNLLSGVKVSREDWENIDSIANMLGEVQPNLLHVFVKISKVLETKHYRPYSSEQYEHVIELAGYGLVDVEGVGSAIRYHMSVVGRQLMLRLRAERPFVLIEQFIDSPR